MERLPLRTHRIGKPKAMLEAAVVLLLIVCLGAPGCQKVAEPNQEARTPPQESVSAGTAETGLPRLLDLGAGKCIPCKKMAPILGELKQEYAGVFDVVFIDVWENGAAAGQYGIEMIPTQIFFDASGKELFRHEGFYGKEEILSKWKELGIKVDKAGT